MSTIATARSVQTAIAAFAAFISIGCDALPGKPTPAERPILASQVADFDVLYAQQCSGCHGADGRTGAARPLNDPLYLALLNVEVLERIIAQGVPGTAMPAFAVTFGGTLTEQQVTILATQILVRWGHPERFRDTVLPAYHTLDAGDAQRGATVYATYCARCHGPDGGGGSGGSIIDSSYLALVSNQALRTAVIVGRGDADKPDWRNNVPGQPMTGQEISDVVAWMIAHRAG